MEENLNGLDDFVMLTDTEKMHVAEENIPELMCYVY